MFVYNQITIHCLNKNVVQVKSQSSSASPLRRGGGVLPDLMASSGPSSSRTSSSSNMPVMKMPSSSTLQAIPTSSKLKSGSVMDFLGSAGNVCNDNFKKRLLFRSVFTFEHRIETEQNNRLMGKVCISRFQKVELHFRTLSS